MMMCRRFFLPLFALCLATLSAWAEEVLADVPAAVEHCMAASPALQEWRNALESSYKKAVAEDGLSPDNRQYLREAVDKALAAADALYRARLLYGLTCINEAYLGQVYDGKGAGEMQQKWIGLLEECAGRDLQRFLACNFWTEERKCPALPPYDGKIDLPRSIRAINSRNVRSNVENNNRACAVMEHWEKLVKDFSAELRHTYDESGDDAAISYPRESLTGVPLECMVEVDVPALMAKLKRLFEQEEAAWEAYRDSLENLFSPCAPYWGTGAPAGTAYLVCHLLNSRDIYLAQIYVGITHSYEGDLEEEEQDEEEGQND